MVRPLSLGHLRDTNWRQTSFWRCRLIFLGLSSNKPGWTAREWPRNWVHTVLQTSNIPTHTIAYQRIPRYTIAYRGIFLHTTVYFCIPRYTTVCYCIALHTTVYQCIPSIHTVSQTSTTVTQQGPLKVLPCAIVYENFWKNYFLCKENICRM